MKIKQIVFYINMIHKRTILVIIVSLLLPFKVCAQIEEYDISSQKIRESVVKYNIPQYDSLYNIGISIEDHMTLSGSNTKWYSYRNSKDSIEKYLAERLFQFIGQTIYFYHTSSYELAQKKEYGYSVQEKEYQGNYYVIDSIVPKTYQEKDYPYGYKIKVVTFKLHKLNDSLDTPLEYSLSTWNLYDQHMFLCMGYYEKLRSMYEHKTLVKLNEGKLYSSETNYSFPKGAEFVCFKVAISESKDYFHPYLFLEDSSGYQYKVQADDWQKDGLMEKTLYFAKIEQDSLEKKQAQMKQKQDAIAKQKQQTEKRNALIKKYGQYYGDLISKGKVVIGMTKEMCRESWGKPTTINMTTGTWGVHEQWVYEGGSKDSYLYFENGKLTTIQN